jgi:stage V sporulation protein AC
MPGRGAARSPEALNRAYQQLARKHHPPRPVAANAVRAFVAGGLASLAGQGVLELFHARGMSLTQAAGATTVAMIGVGALLTGLGWYDRVVRWGGMGGSLPVTGFANAMVAPAMEFRREGFVLGVGAKLFTVAGPVLAYGLLAAFVMGAVRLATGLAH